MKKCLYYSTDIFIPQVGLSFRWNPFVLCRPKRQNRQEDGRQENQSDGERSRLPKRHRKLIIGQNKNHHIDKRDQAEQEHPA